MMAANMSAFECVKNERKSKVWQFFLLNKAERKAKCISCSYILMMRKDGSTSDLLYHLKHKHSTDNKLIKGNKNEKTKSSDKSKMFQPKIIDVMSLAEDKTENFEKKNSSNNGNKSISNIIDELQITQIAKELMPESDRIKESVKKPNFVTSTSKKHPLNEEFGKNKKRNRQSSVKENLIDDQPKVVAI